jgi:hypothetical protein
MIGTGRMTATAQTRHETWWDNARAQCVHDNVMESAQEAVYVRPLTGPVKPSTDRGYLGLRC